MCPHVVRALTWHPDSMRTSAASTLPRCAAMRVLGSYAKSPAPAHIGSGGLTSRAAEERCRRQQRVRQELHHYTKKVFTPEERCQIKMSNSREMLAIPRRSRPWSVGAGVLQALGVYLFVSGFLCTRQELPDTASCADPQAECPHWLPCNVSYAGPPGCDGGWVRTVPEFRFVVLLVVDALRFDFAPEFPAIAKSLAASPTQARLCQFVADAPTTTMQRLKGLTTGGLPTFVDIGRSFDAGIDIQEDNWVHGAIRAGHRVSITGDDTWVSLFPPHRLTKAQPYPSLNVKDIDGCDSHVIKTLPGELTEAAELPDNQRSAIIGHFLGVDHIGHRFGIEHPEMRRKVADMDAVLNETIQWAEEQKRLGRGDTLLLFFGDHGQTVTGDHGGATAEEVESLLFAYSTAALVPPSPSTPRKAATAATARTAPTADFFSREYFAGSPPRPWSEQLPARVPRVMQTDVVPTISLALGMPIPFGNLGAVLPWLLRSTGSPTQDTNNVLSSLHSNVQQVRHFLATYQKATRQALPTEFVRRIEDAYASIMPERPSHRVGVKGEGGNDGGVGGAEDVERRLRDLLEEAAVGARHAWASFDETRMVLGVLALVSAAAFAAAGVPTSACQESSWSDQGRSTGAARVRTASPRAKAEPGGGEGMGGKVRGRGSRQVSREAKDLGTGARLSRAKSPGIYSQKNSL